MRPTDKDTLSRLMDGEWGDVNPSDCLADIGKSDELRERWARYHLARDVMRSEALDERFSVSDQVRSLIASEETYSNVASIDRRGGAVVRPVTSLPGHSALSAANGDAQQMSTIKALPWRQGAAGFALAASVAAATVVGVNVFNASTHQPGGTSVASSASERTLDSQTLPIADDTDAVVVAEVPAQTPTVRAESLPRVELVGFNQNSNWVTPLTGENVPTDADLDMLYKQHIEVAPDDELRVLLPYLRSTSGTAPAAATTLELEASQGSR